MGPARNFLSITESCTLTSHELSCRKVLASRVRDRIRAPSSERVHGGCHQPRDLCFRSNTDLGLSRTNVSRRATEPFRTTVERVARPRLILRFGTLIQPESSATGTDQVWAWEGTRLCRIILCDGHKHMNIAINRKWHMRSLVHRTTAGVSDTMR